MKRLFLLLLFVFALVYLFFYLNPVHIIQPLNDSVSVRIIYHESLYDLELEPYTSLGEVLRELPLGDDVDYRKLNMNQILIHRDTLSLPVISEEACVSINTATLAEMQQLSGVGEKTAQSILDHREHLGFFQNIEDLMLVKGIGAAKFAKMKDYVCL